MTLLVLFEFFVTNLPLSTNEKLLVSWQFSGIYDVTKYGSGRRKDAVNQCLEFATAPEWVSRDLAPRGSEELTLGFKRVWVRHGLVTLDIPLKPGPRRTSIGHIGAGTLACRLQAVNSWTGRNAFQRLAIWSAYFSRWQCRCFTNNSTAFSRQ